MNRSQFVGLSFAAFAIVVTSFVVLGFGRLALGYRTARVLAAPIGLLGFGLVVVLTVLSVLSWTGVYEIEE